MVPARRELIRSVFQVLDKDGDQHLSSPEMHHFAAKLGFQGTTQEWQLEFASLFEGRSDPKEVGVSLSFFEELVNDSSDNGCYCTDEELNQMNTGFLAEARNILINDLFCKLDDDHDGMLTYDNIWSFTSLAGFPSTCDCERVFSSCSEGVDGREAAAGSDAIVRRDGFTRLLQGDLVQECHCSTEKLQQILRRLRDSDGDRLASTGPTSPPGLPSGGVRPPPPPGLPAPPGLDPP